MAHLAPKHAPRNLEAAEKRAKAWELRKGGMTMRDIAAAVGYDSVSGVHSALKKSMAEAIEQAKGTAEEYRQLELDRLERLLRAVWPAAIKGRERSVAEARAIIAQRAKLLGIEIIKTEISGPNGSPLQVLDVSAMTDDQIRAKLVELRSQRSLTLEDGA